MHDRPHLNVKLKFPRVYIYINISLAIIFLMISPSHSKEKRIVGWLELARIHPENFLIRAKLDTGAKNSSINAENIHVFRRDKRRWVRFEVTNYLGHKSIIERKIRRTVRIKEHYTEYQKRFVIKLELCVGDHYKEVDVNIADRSNFDYPLLIGRSFMDGDLLIDPSMQFTTEPNCRKEAAP